MPEKLRGYLPLFIALVVALAGGAGVAIVVSDDDPTTPDRTITIRPPTVDAGEAPPGDLVADPDDPAELKDQTPEEVPPAVLEAGQEKTEDLAEPLEPRPTGGAQNYSCRQDFSGGVYSARSVKPTMWVNHYTVSPNRSGWGDVLGIQAYFKNTRIASSTYIMDFEGHCLQMVPFSGKPWTQGAANPWAVSVEIIATGSESRAEWLASPLIKRGILAAVARDNLRRMGSPLRRVDPVGCVFPPGWTDHNSLECGNDHTDVTPNFPYDVFQRQLVEGAVVNYSTARERTLVRRLRAGTSPTRTCRLARYQRLRMRVLAKRRGWKVRHLGSRYQRLSKAYAKRCGR